MQDLAPAPLATLAEMRAARPAVSYICDTAATGGVGLFVGDRRALADPGVLAARGIGTVINCAVNLDVNAVVTPDPGTEGPMAVGWAHVRYYKLGIIDGAGNPPGMVLAGYLQLAGALAQVIPDKPSYPLRATGNVLVNCRGGRSRSVTVLALWLALHRPDLCPSLEAAVALIRRQRLLHPDEWHEAPKPALLDAARWAANVVRQLPPEP